MQRNLLMINVVEKIKKEDITSKAYAEATLLISVLDLGYSLVILICGIC